MAKTILCILMTICILASIFCSKSAPEDPAFVQAELEWREQRDQRMQTPTSWLTIAGLFWLEEGENTFGTDPQNKIQLPQGSAPAFAGKFTMKGDQVEVIALNNTELTIEDDPAKKKVLKSDAEGRPDVIDHADLKMWVIKRGDRLAIRLRDQNAPAFLNYAGLDFYPPRQKYKLKAKFVPYDPPKMETIATVVGTTDEMRVPGYVSFEIDGKPYRLDAFGDYPESKRLFIVMRDGTSGEETYGASRFMSAEVSDDGSVDLNFNRAYNPPCAYTAFATCPLPPPQNILSVKIEAGEKMYKKGH